MPEDPAFEHEKWLADLELRKRELALKEREQQNRDAELGLKEREHRTSAWRSPLTVAIFAAAAAAAGNAVVAVVNGSSQRALEDKKSSAEFELERSKAESTRILEMIKTGDPERAAANLEFLLESGLISEPRLSSNVAAFLHKRNPGTGPSLPSPSGRLAFEKSELLTESMQQSLQNTLKEYFDYLDRLGFPKPGAAVTVSIEAMDPPTAYYVNNRIVIDRRMAEDPSVALREYNHHLLLTTTKNRDWGGPFAALESGLADYFACSFLKNPNLGEKSARLFNSKSPFIRSLKNRRTYADLPKGREWKVPQVAGEVWGGFFWDIREQLGTSDADALVASTWLSFTVPGNDAQIPSAFIGALLRAAEARGPKVLEAVRAASSARKLPL
jgi:hypothetical protein